LTNIGITNDTPPEKIEKAVDIILYVGRPLDYWLIYEVVFDLVTACHRKLA